jgi:nucleotide-binding universal stress UspA family protein
MVTRVLCGIDGTSADADAVRQAATMAGAEGQLELVAVCVTGGGAKDNRKLTADQAEEALERAQAIATEVGTPTSTRVVDNADDWEGLAGAIADRDLLVLGDHPHSRVSGIVHGSTSTRALHDSAIPVLIARPGADDFPRRILLATNGSTASNHAATFTASIARAHSSAVTLLTIDHVEIRERKHALIEEGAELARACGAEPEIVLRSGDADEEIVAAVRQLEPSLLVLGSGGKHGLRTLGSVSEKVAHNAPCSVLVVKGAAPR